MCFVFILNDIVIVRVVEIFKGKVYINDEKFIVVWCVVIMIEENFVMNKFIIVKIVIFVKICKLIGNFNWIFLIIKGVFIFFRVYIWYVLIWGWSDIIIIIIIKIV